MQIFSKNMALHAAIVWLTCSLSAFGQDFQKTCNITAGGVISIRNISGNVTVRGYDGQDVLVTGYKEGRDRDKVTIEESLSGNNLSIRTRQPEPCNCQVSVRFEVTVPRTISYKFDSITSLSGNVLVSGVIGEINAKSVSGNVSVRNASGPVEATSTSGNVSVDEITGTVNAKSVSGNVDVTILQLSGARDMDFSSVSGNVHVRLPASLDAEVKMSTTSGNVKTDFPLTVVKPEYGPGQRAFGRVGGGAHQLKVTSVSGNVSLLRM